MLKGRVAYLTLAGILAGSLAWAGLNVASAPAPVEDSEQQGSPPASSTPGRFEAELGEPARSARGRIDYAAIDRRLQLLAEQNSVVGLAVGIVEDGEIRFLKGYGETEAGNGEPVTIDTVFRWASVSKGVAGTMTALLAEQGEISLYEPIRKYSATLRLPGGAEERATVSDVLTHRLGIHAHAHDPRLESGEDARTLRGMLAQLDLICPPGQCHAYQNVAFDAAAEAIERVTGRPYEEAVRERLFLPLGMTSATMTMEGLASAPSWARPHVGARRPVEVTDSYYRVPAAGGINSSIKDLALWLRAQLGMADAVLPPKVLEAAHTPRAATPGENARRRKYAERIGGAHYGLGWRVYDYAGHRVVGHRGGVRGYRSLILFDPVRKSGVVAMWNSSTGQPGGLEYEVMDMVYGLPFKDWLELDRLKPRTPDPAEDIGALSEEGSG